MKNYNDFKSDKNSEYLSNEDLAKVKWTKYKILCPTEEDRQELMEAFRHIHYSDINTDFITVNQLAHEYLDETEGEDYRNNIIVNKDIYEKLL